METKVVNDSLKAAVEKTLASTPTPGKNLQQLLDIILKETQMQVGTIHRLSDPASLELVAQSGVPPALLPTVQKIQVGKGMAGLAAQRLAPVSSCDLQTETVNAQPRAKETGIHGAICVPIFQGKTLKGTLGIGTRDAYDFSPEETQTLLTIGSRIAPHL